MADPADLVAVGRTVTVTALRVCWDTDELLMEHALDKETPRCARFQTRVTYPAGVLSALRPVLGEQGCRTLFCHVALVESLKYTVTFPHTLDVTLIADGLTTAAADFVRDVASCAWTQHMWENKVAAYRGPTIVAKGTGVPSQQAPLVGRPVNATLLCANGGGKDSFLVLKTLERAGFSVAVFQHARSEYGALDMQHALQRRILRHIGAAALAPDRVHQLSVTDDVTDGARIRQLNPKLRGECVAGRPCQVGWPEMVFEALPFVLLHGYRALVFGNERSADAPQANWAALDHVNGQVNHQWLKSYAAECRLRAFMRGLCPALEVFSLLKPLHDYRIYRLLAAYPEVLPDMHSCNVQKPWCWRCAKCAYVWANLVAHFGLDVVAAGCACRENLFDVEALQPVWARLLGVGTAAPAWECVGERAETAAALQQCLARGVRGQALTTFAALLPDMVPRDLVATHDVVHATAHNIPPDVWAAVYAYL